MAKCIQISCEEEGYPYEFEGNTYILCSYHKNKVLDVIRNQRGIGINNHRSSDNDWEDCQYCRLSDGRPVGRFNKKTQECDFFGCKKSAFYKERERIINLPKECKYCNEKIKGGEDFQKIDDKTFFCSLSQKEEYLKKQKETLEKKEQQMAEMRKFSAHMKMGKSLTELYDNWESVAAEFPQDIRNDLYQYQKNIGKIQDCAEQIEELGEEERKNNFSNSSSNLNNNKQSINSNYSNSLDNYINQTETKKQQSNQSSTNSSSKPNTPSNKPSIELEIDPSSYQFEDSNSEQDTNFKKAFKEILEEINKGGGSTILLPTNLSKQQRVFLDAWQRAKICDEYVDINKLDLPRWEKLKLNDLFKFSKVSNFSMVKDSNEKLLPRTLIIVFVIFLIVIPIILIIRKRRMKLKKSK